MAALHVSFAGPGGLSRRSAVSGDRAGGFELASVHPAARLLVRRIQEARAVHDEDGRDGRDAPPQDGLRSW